ncbi:MAG: hypothetical protein LBG52_02390 [Candidatus Peribacteria bacterium]|jgi:hypothetical protein|nr:hypothetical protein [Candidatus Peribacteria bacterium]
MKKILISSQDFGYGATTQLFALLKHLLDEHHQEVNIHILANASSQTFYTNFLKYNPAYDSCLSFIHNPEKEYDTYV